MEFVFYEVFEAAITWVDSRFGRVVAWMAAVGIIIIGIGIMAGLIYWLLR